MKNYSTQLKQAIANDNPIVVLVEMQLAGGIIRLTTAAHDITYLGEQWVSSGLMLDISNVQERRELTVQSLTMQFSASDLTIVALFSGANQQNRKVILRTVVLDDEHQVIGELYSKLFVIDSYSDDTDDDDATFTVELSNFLSDFEAVRGMRTTQTSFARFYPNTTSFINSKDIKADLKWGGE